MRLRQSTALHKHKRRASLPLFGQQSRGICGGGGGGGGRIVVDIVVASSKTSDQNVPAAAHEMLPRALSLSPTSIDSLLRVRRATV